MTDLSRLTQHSHIYRAFTSGGKWTLCLRF